MENWWKQLGAWATALKNSFKPDIFTAARFKIVFLYLLMGLIILGVAGYLVYTRIISIIEDILVLVEQLLRDPSVVHPGTVSSLIAQALNVEIAKMNLVIGLWLLLTMVIAAYILASVTIQPIKRAMERQKRFIGNVSHELRTPLSVMKMSSEVALLNVSDVSRDELENVLKTNIEEVDRMTKIIQFLLQFSVSERPVVSSSLEVDLGEIALKVLSSMDGLARRKEIGLEFKGEREAWVHGDATALDEMVTNLLKNSIAYTPSHGAVTLSIRKHSERAFSHGIPKRTDSFELSVRDTGIGIPPQDLPNIFEAFYRGGNAFSQRSKKRGVGLGLAIVYEIVKLHKATIAVESELGKGTTMIVTFPAAR